MNKSLEMAGNMFVFNNPCCDCKITTNYRDDGTKYHELQMKIINGSHKFAYAPIEGLVMMDSKTGAIIENNKVLEDFLNIKLNDVEDYKNFIDKYGFVTNIPDDNKYKTLNYLDIGFFVERFRSLIQLMTALEENYIDYENILRLLAFLLFSAPRKILLREDDDEGLYSCIHPFTKLWYKIDEIPELNMHLKTSDSNDPYDDYFSIPDTFTERDGQLGLFEYQESLDNAESAYGNNSNSFNAKITKLYKNAFNKYYNYNSRTIIDYFYNLLKLDVKINDISVDGKITSNINLKNNSNFDKTYKEKLLIIAKQTIKEELDFALVGIHPTYDIYSMSPNWEIPNLITALYFAIFYTRPGYEVYRKCANPNCGRLFKVKTTNSKKMYHDPSCQNAAAQMRHRKIKNRR